MGKNLIGISAKISGGKDTFFNIIQKKVNNIYENKKFAWKLKEIAEKLTGTPAYDFEKEDVKNSYLPEEWNYLDKNGNECKMTCREFMQKLGTDGLRDGLHKNVWVNSLFSDYKITNKYKLLTYDVIHFPENQYLKYPNWCISDVRFTNEADAIKKRGGIIIRLNRDFTWSQFCNTFGLIEPIAPPTKFSTDKNPTLFYGEYLKNIHSTSEEIQTALKKIFHSSETSLDNYSEFDYVIENNGTVEDYEKKIDECLKYFEINLENASILQ